MRTLPKWLALTMLLTYILIVVGAAVRVADAGMSCPDWPMCYGKAWPFPVSLEETGYTNLQVFLEWFHRLLASVVGVMILIGSIWSFMVRKRHKMMPIFGVLSLLMLVSQVFLGMVTVNMSNENWTVALHLGNAMILFGLLVTWRRLAALGGEKSESVDVNWKGKAVLWVITLSVFLTMLLGAMVSTSYAGGSCGGLFSCHGEWMPKGDLGQLLHMKHRYMALFTFLLIVAYFIKSCKGVPEVRKTAMGLKILVTVQVVIGIATLYSFSDFAGAYQALSVFHLAWGTLLFMACCGGLTKYHFGLGGSFHEPR